MYLLYTRTTTNLTGLDCPQDVADSQGQILHHGRRYLERDVLFGNARAGNDSQGDRRKFHRTEGDGRLICPRPGSFSPGLF